MSVSITAPSRASYGGDQPRAVAGLTGSGSTVDVYPRDPDEQHKQMVRWFEESEMARTDEIANAEQARSYFDGAQWTQAELDALKARGQPAVVINKISGKIGLLCGLERKARTMPKAFPRTPEEDERADAATQALRYIADDNTFDVVRSQVFENMLVEGAGGVELGLSDDGRGGADINITVVPWDRIWYDPHSRAYDFLDARYKGLVIWMDRDQLEETYPGADDVIDAAFSSNADLAYRDRPDSVMWSDNRRERVRVVQCHWQERGTWYSATFAKQGLLTEIIPSPFKDRRGKSACGLILQSAYIDRDNRRYGMVRGLISLQDEINKRRSKALHLLSVRQVIAEQGAVKDVDKARREVARPDGYVEITPGMKFEIEPGGDLAVGQFNLLKHATDEMQLSGPNAAMSGTDSRELSGRAILAQQAGGAVQNEPLADSLRMWSRRVYETSWMAAREYWGAGKFVRVTDDLGTTRYIGINMPVTMRDALAQMPEQQRAAVMQQMQLAPGDPRLEQVIRTENKIDDLDVDITVEEGPSTPTQQMEEFQTLVQLTSMQPGLIPGEVLLAASSLKNKDQLLKMMEAHKQQQGQMQQQAAQMAGQHAQAEIASKQAKAAADMALAKERNIAAVRGIHDVHAAFSAPPYGQPHVAPDPPSAPGTVMPMAAHAGGGLVRRHEPMPAPRTTLGEQDEVEMRSLDRPMQPPPQSWRSLLPRYQEIDPNFREFGTGDAGRMPFVNRRLGLGDQLSGGDPPLYPTPPGELPPTTDRNTLPPGYAPPSYWSPMQMQADPRWPQTVTPMAHATGGPVRQTTGAPDYTDRLFNQRPVMPGADPRMQINPSQFTRDNAELTDSGHMIQDGSGWQPQPNDRPDLRRMSGGDPAGPDNGWITAREGEYVLNQGAVQKYGQPLLDAINSGAIDPKVLELAAGHAAADLREKHARAAMAEAKVGSEAARTNDLLHGAILKVAQVRQMHHEMTHPTPPASRQ